MAMSAEHRWKFWRLHKSEKFLSGTINPKQTKTTTGCLTAYSQAYLPAASRSFSSSLSPPASFFTDSMYSARDRTSWWVPFMTWNMFLAARRIFFSTSVVSKHQSMTSRLESSTPESKKGISFHPPVHQYILNQYNAQKLQLNKNKICKHHNVIINQEYIKHLFISMYHLIYLKMKTFLQVD